MATYLNVCKLCGHKATSDNMFTVNQHMIAHLNKEHPEEVAKIRDRALSNYSMEGVKPQM